MEETCDGHEEHV